MFLSNVVDPSRIRLHPFEELNNDDRVKFSGLSINFNSKTRFLEHNLNMENDLMSLPIK